MLMKKLISLKLSRYIVLNPVKAHMVELPEDWQWSSYKAMIKMVKLPEWLSVDEVLIQFGKNHKKVIEHYQQLVIEGIKNGPIWEQLKRQVYLGDDNFIEKIQVHLEGHINDVQIPKSQKRGKALSLKEYQQS